MNRLWVVLVASVLLVLAAQPVSASIADKRNDYNGDGVSDLIAISDDCLYRWNGNGRGGFGPATVVGCGWSPYEDALAAVGDITGDGRADLVALDATWDGDQVRSCLWRWSGAGASGFGVRTLLGCGWEDFWVNGIVGAGDLNNDGAGDLLGVSSAGVLYRWNGTGTGTFGAGTQVGGGWYGSYENTVTGAGDLNRDGNADIVAISRSDNCLYRWSGNGQGGFGTGTRLGCGWVEYTTNIAGMGDLNRDGPGDLVAVYDLTGELVRWSGDGAGSYGTGVQIGGGWAQVSFGR